MQETILSVLGEMLTLSKQELCRLKLVASNFRGYYVYDDIKNFITNPTKKLLVA